MLKSKRYLYVGFMCNQAVEKIFKAYYVKTKKEQPPYTHKLIRLAEESNLYKTMSEEQKDFIFMVTPLNVEARYPTQKKDIFESLNKKIPSLLTIPLDIDPKSKNFSTKLLQEAIDMTKKHDEILDMRAKSAFSEKFKFEEEFEKVINKTDNPEKLLYFISPFLLPKKIKTFNPMKSLESQKLSKPQKEEVIKEKIEAKELETIDKITTKRVVSNFKFYFQNLLGLLKNKNEVSLKNFADFIIKNYGEKSLYNGDFIAFAIYLNRKKYLKQGEDEIFDEFSFRTIMIIPKEEDIDLGNGLKITNMGFKKLS